MVVAVPAVGVVEVALDQIVRMIAMRDRRVPATRGVDIAGGVSLASMIRRAASRVVASTAIAHSSTWSPCTMCK